VFKDQSMMSIKPNILLILLFVAMNTIKAQELNENNIYEEFVLSDNRQEVLQKLIPGTEIYFFLNTLYLQQSNKIQEAEEFLLKWQEKLSPNEKYQMMKNRQNILQMESKPQVTLKYIKEFLDLSFDMEMPINLTPHVFPSVLPDEILNIDLKITEKLTQDFELKEFTDQGLFKISKEKLTDSQIVKLLNRYPYPDLPGIVDLILKDFKSNQQRLFGDLTIHNQLTLTQLKELLNANPNLLTHKNFVFQYLKKLIPVSSKKNPTTQESEKKILAESWGFVKNLNPSFNTIKAIILNNYLITCLALNEPDIPLFQEYLKLPRNQTYANTEYYQKLSPSNQFIKYNEHINDLAILKTIEPDIEMIKQYLYEMIRSKAELKDIQPFFEKSFFDKFEAETKIKLGITKPEEFFQVLNPDELKKLYNSIEISFTKQNKAFHLSNDEISLFVHLKNISELEIQIYKLNALDYYRQNLAEIEPEVSLEGYVPNFTRKINYNYPSYIQHQQKIDLKELNKPGIYIVELLGNGIKNRTYIRKGHLSPVVSNAIEGQQIQLFDDNQNKITDFFVYMGKHELKSNHAGIVMIPYSTAESERKKIVLSTLDLARIYDFYHVKKQYTMTIHTLNTPETILPGQNSHILIKPFVMLNEKPIRNTEVTNIKATIQVFNRKNELINLKPFFPKNLDDILDFKIYVPENATHLTIQLEGTIINKAEDEEQTHLSDARTITLIGSKSQSSILGLYLKKENDNFFIECLNKAGIPQPNISVQFRFNHQYLFTDIATTLQTDQNGVIQLKKLKNVALLKAKLNSETFSYWNLLNPYTLRPTNLTTLENEPLGLPFNPKSDSLSEDVLLVKKSGNNIIEDITNQLRIENDILKIPTHTIGEFTLHLKKEDRSIDILVLEGKKVNPFYVTKNVILDASIYIPHQIVVDPIKENAQMITGKIINMQSDIKVFMWTGRYYWNLPYFVDKYNNLFYRQQQEFRFSDYKPNSFLDSIKLSDEQRYILERRNAKKYPGNLLNSPSTLLNPWSLANTDGVSGDGQGGGGFGSRSGGGKRRAVMKGGGVKATETSDNNFFGFLPNAIIQEIMVNKDGAFEVDLKPFQDQQFIQLGILSPYGYTIKELPLATKEKKLLNISQPKSNEPANIISLTTMSTIEPNKALTFPKSKDGEYLLIDTLEKLKLVLDKSITHYKFKEFNFLLHWGELKEEQKLLKYQEFACHELHFFIYLKDQKFFNRHIKTFLKNKQVKTMIDHWLLDENLDKYLSLNEFNKLNLFEKILLIKKHPNLTNIAVREIQDYLEVNKPNKEKGLEIMEQLLSNEKINQNTFLAKNGSAEKKRDVYGSDGEESPTIEGIVLDEPMEKPAEKELTIINKSEDFVVDGDLEIIYTEEALDSIKKTVELYRSPKNTKVTVEANYYRLERKDESTNLIQPSQFWLDYINNKAPFISHHILNFTNIHEAILALALMDLPEKAIEPKISNQDEQITITTNSPTVIVYNSTHTGEYLSDHLTMQHHYFHFQDTDRISIVPKKDSFTINRKYNCSTVCTNTTNQKLEFYITHYIPEGSISLEDTLRKKTDFVSLLPYTSYVMESQFFFPNSNTYSHIPSKAQNNKNFFTNENPYPLTVIASKVALDKDSWEYIITTGNKDNILNYIKTKNLSKINLEDIYYMMKDSDFFEKVTAALRARFHFDYGIWSFSVYHNDKNKIVEFLPNTNFRDNCGDFLSSSLLNIDAINLKKYQHKEFLPLIKGRSHPTISRNDFENAQAKTQYEQFIQYLIFKPSLNNSDLMNLTIYAIYQQNIDLAIQLFSKINTNQLTEQLQYDYLTAYLAFYQKDLNTAESILVKYKDLSIIQWKEKFTELETQLQEIKSGEIDKDSRKDRFSLTSLAERETFINAKLNLDSIELFYKNTQQATISFYELDLEIIFSNSPFDNLDKHIKFITTPNAIETIALGQSTDNKSVKIPDSLINKNLVIKVSANGKDTSLKYYPSKLNILISENYGELRVLSKDTKKAMAEVYIKVYGKKNSSHEFVKDGYTDLRGVFNYSAVSGKQIKQFSELAILVLSPTDGASIHYVVPPQ